jgi:hypothetical protein
MNELHVAQLALDEHVPAGLTGARPYAHARDGWLKQFWLPESSQAKVSPPQNGCNGSTVVVIATAGSLVDCASVFFTASINKQNPIILSLSIELRNLKVYSSEELVQKMKLCEFTITNGLANVKLFHKSLVCLSKVSTQVQFGLSPRCS